MYQFDEENLEAVPITASQLLHSSFRYSDDLVFSGGKEVKSYGKYFQNVNKLFIEKINDKEMEFGLLLGVSSITGKILYECGINGCVNITDGEMYIEQEILIVQRFQQTVRAVEPRTGIEK